MSSPYKAESGPVLKICFVLTILAALLSILAPVEASSHKLRVFAWVSGDTVSLESALSGGRQLVNGNVMVKNSATNAIITQGVTNSKGVFSFPLPQSLQKNPVDIRIIVSTDDGHRAEWLLKHDEYGMSQAAEPTLTEQPKPTDQPPSDKRAETFSAEELKEVMDELLEKKLAPIRRQLALASEEKMSFRDIIGGIGYLIGLAGLAAWLKRDTTNRDN